jgi:glycosyltransferase involved in cell wall biosynthesis
VRQIAAHGADSPGLRIALLSYRGKEHCGGQGIYVRNLSRELVRLGHHIDVIAGQPYPVLDDGVSLRRLPSLDLYRDDDPFRVPGLSQYRDPIDALEFATMCLAGFPEPLTFSLRALAYLRGRRHDFDVVHDNQSLGYGLLGLRRLGIPLVATIHHPLTVDRTMSLAAATGWQRISLRRWYAFVRMQRRVAQRLPVVLTVSESSRTDIARDLGVDPQRMRVVPVGVDPEVFRPDEAVAPVPGRIVTMASADVPLKGLVHLLEALAKVRTEHDADLVVIGKPQPDGPTLHAVRRLGLTGAVRFVNELAADDLVRTIQRAEVAVVPSLYEGFSLPAIEFMACGVPLVATTGGALPEVVGRDGDTGFLVPPGDEGALATAIRRLLSDETLRTQVGSRGRERVLSRFTWTAAAAVTAEAYEAAIEAGRRRAHRRL